MINILFASNDDDYNDNDDDDYQCSNQLMIKTITRWLSTWMVTITEKSIITTNFLFMNDSSNATVVMVVLVILLLRRFFRRYYQCHRRTTLRYDKKRWWRRFCNLKRWLVIDTDSSIDTEKSDITITNNNSDTTVQVVTTTVSIGGDEGAKKSSAEVVTVEQRRASVDKHDDDVGVASSSSSSTPLTNPISSSLLSIIGFHDTTTNVEDFLLPLSIEVLTPSSSSSFSQERHHSRLPYRFHRISVDVGPNDDDNYDNDEKTHPRRIFASLWVSKVI